MYSTADLVTFTEEILNGKLHFLFSDIIITVQGQTGAEWKYSSQGAFLSNSMVHVFCFVDIWKSWFKKLKFS